MLLYYRAAGRVGLELELELEPELEPEPEPELGLGLGLAEEAVRPLVENSKIT